MHTRLHDTEMPRFRPLRVGPPQGMRLSRRRPYDTLRRTCHCEVGRTSAVADGCVKTVSKPLPLGTLELCSSESRLPKLLFSLEVVRTKRAFRADGRAPKAGTLPLVKRTWSHGVRGLSRFDVPFAPPNLLIFSERIIRIICDVEDETAKSPEVGTIFAVDLNPRFQPAIRMSLTCSQGLRRPPGVT